METCQFFYECIACGERLRPVPGDCCVFCSYGSVPCPPVQDERAGVGAASCARGKSWRTSKPHAGSNPDRLLRVEFA